MVEIFVAWILLFHDNLLPCQMREAGTLCNNKTFHVLGILNLLALHDVLPSVIRKGVVHFLSFIFRCFCITYFLIAIIINVSRFEAISCKLLCEKALSLYFWVVLNSGIITLATIAYWIDIGHRTGTVGALLHQAFEVHAIVIEVFVQNSVLYFLCAFSQIKLLAIVVVDAICFRNGSFLTGSIFLLLRNFLWKYRQLHLLDSHDVGILLCGSRFISVTIIVFWNTTVCSYVLRTKQLESRFRDVVGYIAVCVGAYFKIVHLLGNSVYWNYVEVPLMHAFEVGLDVLLREKSWKARLVVVSQRWLYLALCLARKHLIIIFVVRKQQFLHIRFFLNIHKLFVFCSTCSLTFSHWRHRFLVWPCRIKEIYVNLFLTLQLRPIVKA